MINDLKIKILGVCMISMLAMGAASAPSVFAATHNPEFRWCEERAEGKFENAECSKEGKGKWELVGKSSSDTEGLEAKSNGNQKFTLTIGSTKVTTECKALKLSGGKISGGEGEKEKRGGAGEGVVVFEECTIVGLPNCTINEGSFETAPLFTNLSFETKEAAEKGVQEIGGVSHGVIWFKPKIETETGTQVFVKTFVIKGAACAIKGEFPMTTVQNPPNHDGGLARVLGRPEAEHSETHEVEFNSNQRVFWYVEKEKPTEQEVEGVKAGGNEVKWEGKAVFKLKNKERWWEVN